MEINTLKEEDPVWVKSLIILLVKKREMPPPPTYTAACGPILHLPVPASEAVCCWVSTTVLYYIGDPVRYQGEPIFPIFFRPREADMPWSCTTMCDVYTVINYPNNRGTCHGR